MADSIITDEIVEKAVNAYCAMSAHQWDSANFDIKLCVHAALLSAAPAIERAALERAAKVADEASNRAVGLLSPVAPERDYICGLAQQLIADEIASAIRALAGKDAAT